jgi:hypothetical protein
MSLVRFDRSPDLQRLRDEGYTVSVEESGHVVVRDVPYLTSAGEVAFGVLVAPLSTSGDAAAQPPNHQVWFVGQAPSNRRGERLRNLINSEGSFLLSAALEARFHFSTKPADKNNYDDYYEMFSNYATILEAHAQSVDPGVTAKRFRPVADEDPTSPFMYLDSASSRAGVAAYASRLELPRVAIVGLGDTGSYVLDLISKTRVGEIHLFDGDDLLTHNAFRAPGAASLAELNKRPKKVAYLAAQYSVLKRGIVEHPYHVHEGNVAELRPMDFVFLCMEGGQVKRSLVEAMEAFDLTFIDVGLDVQVMGGALGGGLQVTTSTPGQRDHLRRRVSFAEPTDDDLYDHNIQMADLNALNATLAVIKWKKLFGFYLDLEHEHFTAYALDGNQLVNEEFP